VANLGTEHRAAASHLQYRSDIASEISRRIGPRLCLHGTSSVPADKLGHLFTDGICKVNIWTALERDSAPILFREMVKNAAKISGSKTARDMLDRDLLGKKADLKSTPALSHFTTTYRQDLIFQQMKNIITSYLKIWYV